MRINADCIECMIRRNLETARLHGNDAQVTEFALDLMRLILKTPEASSPCFAPEISRLYQKHFGLDPDRYAEEKRLSNQFVLERMDQIRDLVSQSEDRLYAAFQFAILGNYIDFSALQGELSFDTLDAMLQKAKQFHVDAQVFARLRRDLASGKELLYLTDNAGEIGFDRIFAEEIHRQYPDLHITFCVRGGPALNDATREDAAIVGIPFPVIDNGNCTPGTVLSLAGDDLLAALKASDVVIAKGQANAETLMDTHHGYNVYYAFLAKCIRFTQRFSVPKLSAVLTQEMK